MSTAMWCRGCWPENRVGTVVRLGFGPGLSMERIGPRDAVSANVGATRGAVGWGHVEGYRWAAGPGFLLQLGFIYFSRDLRESGTKIL
jgi:hypothetical protein